MGAMIILFSAGQPIFIFLQVGKIGIIIIIYIYSYSKLFGVLYCCNQNNQGFINNSNKHVL